MGFGREGSLEVGISFLDGLHDKIIAFIDKLIKLKMHYVKDQPYPRRYLSTL